MPYIIWKRGVYQFPYEVCSASFFYMNRIDHIVPFMRKCLSAGNTLAESLKMFGITIATPHLFYQQSNIRSVQFICSYVYKDFYLFNRYNAYIVYLLTYLGGTMRIGIPYQPSLNSTSLIYLLLLQYTHNYINVMTTFETTIFHS